MTLYDCSAGPTLYGILPYAGLKFFVYETLKANLSAEAEPPLSAKLACGAVAGVVGQTVTYPLDVVRRQMQVMFSQCLLHHKSLDYLT